MVIKFLEMNVTISKTDAMTRIVVIDILLLAAICLVPTLSHLFAVPLFKANPMLLALLASMLLVSDRRNAFVLALALPLVSMVVSGMPTPMKALCMMAELSSVVAVFSLMSLRRAQINGWTSFGSILLAIVAGKGVYYLLKALLISPAVLIGTNIWLQLGTTLLFAALFAIATRRTKRD